MAAELGRSKRDHHHGRQALSQGLQTVGVEHGPRRLLQPVLLVPDHLRPRAPVHDADSSQQPSSSGDETSGIATEETPAGKPEVGIEETAGVKLHNGDADRGGQRLLGRRGSSRYRVHLAYMPEHVRPQHGFERRAEHGYLDNRVSHHPFVPDKLLHLLRYEQAVQEHV